MPDAPDEIIRLAVILTDANGKILLVNSEVERLFGYNREELLSQSIDILVPTAIRGRHSGHRASFVAYPEARRMGVGRDLFGVRKDGRQIAVEIGLNPIETGDGLTILCAITDITARKLSDERFQLVVEACSNGIIMTDSDGKIVLMNAEAERLFGYPREELLGKSVDVIVPAMARLTHVGAASEACRMGIGRDLYGTRKDGTQIPIEIRLNPIQTRDGLVILSAITDISERKPASLDLAERSEQSERSNADLSPAAEPLLNTH